MVFSFLLDLLCFHVDQPKLDILFYGNQIAPFTHTYTFYPGVCLCHLLGLMHK